MTNENKGMLIASHVSFKLPCREKCPYEGACATKYFDGACKRIIDSFIDTKVYGTPGDITRTEEGELRFETTTPGGKVVIRNGWVLIDR